MARIRTIKPEFWVSEQVAECSVNARLLFIGVWNFADDGGVIPRRPLQLKMQIFPADPFTKEQIEGWTDELINAGLIHQFETEGVTYLWVTGWDKHQRIDHPNRKYPAPFGDSAERSENSPNAREDSQNVRSGRERIGRERIGEDKELPTEACGEICEDDISPPPQPDEPTEFEFPTEGKAGKTWTLGQKKLAEYIAAYPSLDVHAELRAARQWVRDNPTKRKTAGGMLGFLTRWLNRAQNRGPGVRAGPAPPPSRPTMRAAPTL